MVTTGRPTGYRGGMILWGTLMCCAGFLLVGHHFLMRQRRQRAAQRRQQPSWYSLAGQYPQADDELSFGGVDVLSLDITDVASAPGMLRPPSQPGAPTPPVP